MTIIVFDPLAGDQGHLVRDVAHMAQALADLPVSVEVRTSQAGVRATDARGLVGVRAWPYRTPSGPWARRLGARIVAALRTFLTLGGRHGAQVVVFHATEELSVLVLRMCRPRLPILVCLTNNLGGNDQRPVKRLLLRLALTVSDGVAVYSDYDLRKVASLLGRNMRGVVKLPYAPLGSVRPMLPLRERQPHVVMLGHSNSEKGVERFLSLARSDRAGRYRFRLHGVGMPERLADENIRSSSGFLSEEDYWRLIGTATYVVLPYHPTYAGKLSGVFVDAVVCGTPVVVPNIAPFNAYFSRYGPLGILGDFESPESIVGHRDWVPAEARFRMFQEAARRVVADNSEAALAKALGEWLSAAVPAAVTTTRL